MLLQLAPRTTSTDSVKTIVLRIIISTQTSQDDSTEMFSFEELKKATPNLTPEETRDFTLEETKDEWAIVNVNEIIVNIDGIQINDDWEHVTRKRNTNKSYLEAVLHKASFVTNEQMKKPVASSSSWQPAMIVVNNDSVGKKRANREYVSDTQQSIAYDDDADIENFYFESVDIKRSIGMQRLKGVGRIGAKSLKRR